MSWLAPSAAATDPELQLPAPEVALMKQWMLAALQEAASPQNPMNNAAIIVDSESGIASLLISVQWTSAAIAFCVMSSPAKMLA